MAKGSLFFAKARGKIGQIVLSNVNGQEVARSYNENPANPKTANQMYQRGLFADVVKFYTRGQQNFFKFAFENKKKTESDYNAFVRANMPNGCYLTKEVIDGPVYPKVGQFIMTQGSIPAASYDFAMDDDILGVDLFIGTHTIPQLGQVSGISKALKMWNPAIQDGDIITLCTITSDCTFASNMPMYSYINVESSDAHEPRWQIKQFIVDETDNRALTSMGLGVNDGQYSIQLMNPSADGMGLREQIAAACLCVSRNTPTGLKVMTSQLALSYGARRVLARTGATLGYLEDSYRDLYLKSWGTSEKVILQGALAKAKETGSGIELLGVWDGFGDTFDDVIANIKSYDAIPAPAEVEINASDEVNYVAMSVRNAGRVADSDITISGSNLELREVVLVNSTTLVLGLHPTGVYTQPANIDILGDTAFKVTAG